MGRFAGRKHAPRVSRTVARTRTEHVSKDAGPDCRCVRHPRPFSIPDDRGGHRPCDRGEFLVRDDAGLAGRPARRRGLDVRRSGSTLRPLPPSAHRLHRRDGRTQADLADLMGPEQDGLERILAEATQELRGLLDSGDERVRRLLAKGHEALTRAQAATIYFRRETLDIDAMRDIATGLPSPDPSLPWLDRLAIYASWPSNIALFDAGFA